MTSPKIATITVESEPHDMDISTAILNRPLPNSGAFLIWERLPKEVWNHLKAAGAWYLSRDDLEEFDMFESEPGWRYPIQALATLIGQGYTLAIRGESISTEEQLRGLFTAEAKAAYKQRIEDERAAAERARQEVKTAAEIERASRGTAYAVWQQTFVAGLVSTSIGPDYSAGQYGTGGPWELVYRAEKGTPGAWYDTGDEWYRSTTTGALRRDYGNASLWYAPQDMVDGWVLACDTGSVAYARRVLEMHGYGVHGSDAADRLVELKGLQHYIDRATSEEWLVKAGDYSSRQIDILAHYGIAATPIALRKHDQKFKQGLQETLGFTWSDRGAPSNVGQAPDGRWFSTTDTFNGGGWRLLTAEECQKLGLDMTPPAQPPTLPAAKPLPSAEETNERSRRFSDIFSG